MTLTQWCRVQKEASFSNINNKIQYEQKKKNRHDSVRRRKGDYNIIIMYNFSMSLQPEDATQSNGGGGYAR